MILLTREITEKVSFECNFAFTRYIGQSRIKMYVTFYLLVYLINVRKILFIMYVIFYLEKSVFRYINQVRPSLHYPLNRDLLLPIKKNVNIKGYF